MSQNERSLNNESISWNNDHKSSVFKSRCLPGCIGTNWRIVITVLQDDIPIYCHAQTKLCLCNMVSISQPIQEQLWSPLAHVHQILGHISWKFMNLCHAFVTWEIDQEKSLYCNVHLRQWIITVAYCVVGSNVIWGTYLPMVDPRFYRYWSISGYMRSLMLWCFIAI